MHGIRVISTPNQSNDEPLLIETNNDEIFPDMKISDTYLSKLNYTLELLRSDNELPIGNYIIKVDIDTCDLRDNPNISFNISGDNIHIKDIVPIEGNHHHDIYFIATVPIKTITATIINCNATFYNANLYHANKDNDQFNAGYCDSTTINEPQCRDWMNNKVNAESVDIINKFSTYCTSTDKLELDPVCNTIFRKRSYKNKDYNNRVNEQWNTANNVIVGSRNTPPKTRNLWWIIAIILIIIVIVILILYNYW